MKILLTLIFITMFSQSYAQSYMSSVRPDGSSSGAVMEDSNVINDTVGTTQSSTTAIATKSRRMIPMAPDPKFSTEMNCIDRSGKNFDVGDSGYTECANSLMTR